MKKNLMANYAWNENKKQPNLYSELMSREWHTPTPGEGDRYRDNWDRIFAAKKDEASNV